MSIYTPFTYIIGWSEHKKFYYGAKWAKGCHPNDLWESYFTSSEYVKDFRKENGEPDIIRIHRIFDNPKDCVTFESKYLIRINAKNNPLFLNKINGSVDFGFYDREKAKKTCLELYGYEFISQIPEIKKKRIVTNLKKYGEENYNNREKAKETWGKKYFSGHPLREPEIKEKSKQTCLQRYEVEFTLQVPKFRTEANKTIFEIYGVENVSKSQEIKNKKVNTCLENFGVEHPGQIKRVCNFCRKLKSISHEPKCKENPDRKVPIMLGTANPSTKYYKIVSPEKKIFYITSRTEAIEFAKERNLKHNPFMNNKIEGWNIIKSNKPFN